MSSEVDLIEFWEGDVLPQLSVERVYEGIPWRVRGNRYWRGPCPLHGGDGPNFSVDTHTLRWRCFSHCGAGSLFSFLNDGVEPRGEAWVKTLRELADFAAVPWPARDLPPPGGEAWRRLEENQRHAHLLETFAALAQNLLLSSEGTAARDYLTGRGFQLAALPDLPFGLYPLRSTVTEKLREAGFNTTEIEASGLTRDGRWEGRLLIFWRDARGRLGTIAARALTGHSENKDKYLYLSRENGFARAKADLVAFGLDTALPALRRGAPHLLLVEGLLDALMLQTHGFEAVAAIGGSGIEMSAARWQALHTLGMHSVVALMDNDPHADGRWPGREGALHLARLGACPRERDNVPINSVGPIVVNGNVNGKDANRDNGNLSNVGPIAEIVAPHWLGRHKDADAYVRSRGIAEFCELLQQRQSAATFLAAEAIGEVVPGSSEASRRAAVEAVLDLDARLSGPRAALDRVEVRRLASERTGFPLEAIAEIADERAAQERERALQRALSRMLREAAREAAPENFLGGSALLARLGEEIAVLRQRAVAPPPPFSVERLETESRHLPAGKSTGWTALDNLSVQFSAGELALVGARTGHGKTSFLVALALNWLDGLMERDELLVFYTLEEPELRLYHRLLALLSSRGRGELDDSRREGWSVAQVRDFLRDPESRGARYGWPDPALLDAGRAFLREREARLQVVFQPTWTIDDIESHARALAARRPVGGVVVDYLQRIPPPVGRFDRRDQEVSATGRRLKALSVDIAAPVVAGAQINREAIPEGFAKQMNSARTYAEAQKNIRAARPELHHLREGGSEQEADLALGLLNYAADYRGETPPPQATRLEVGTLKNRNGEPGKWTSLVFEGRYGLIRDPHDKEAF